MLGYELFGLFLNLRSYISEDLYVLKVTRWEGSHEIFLSHDIHYL